MRVSKQSKADSTNALSFSKTEQGKVYRTVPPVGSADNIYMRTGQEACPFINIRTGGSLTTRYSVGFYMYVEVDAEVFHYGDMK